MKLTSSAFEHQEMIPVIYTCMGQDVNPPLKFSEVPEETQSLVLVCDDPDAATDPDGPGVTFDHWVVFNINPATNMIGENSVPEEATQGNNNTGQAEYMGPCPPNGTHRYFFKLYALDTQLDLAEGSSKSAVEGAMEGHILEQAELVGLFEK